MTVRRMERSEIIEMIRRAAATEGMSLEQFYAAGRNNELESADLRDLWLIWGSALEDGDLTPVA